MRVLIVLATIILTASTFALSNLAREEWNTFKLTHGKQYEDEAKELSRMEIFMQKKMMVGKHNQRYEEGLETYSMGINQFSDLTDEELDHTIGGYDPSEKFFDFDNTLSFISPANVVIPKHVDWRNNNLVTSVKNQGDHCGSCWAFSAVGAIEGQLFTIDKNIINLSVQSLVDCSSSDGNDGCDGGSAIAAFKDIRRMGGILPENKYSPYKARQEFCRFNKKFAVAKVVDSVSIDANETKLMEAVATVGPISATLFFDNRFACYKSGIFSVTNCTKDKLRKHAVLIIGYGRQFGLDYWIVKNSHGKKWGEKGYFRIARNMNHMCGIGNDAVYPLLRKVR